MRMSLMLDLNRGISKISFKPSALQLLVTIYKTEDDTQTDSKVSELCLPHHQRPLASSTGISQSNYGHTDNTQGQQH